MINFYKHTIRLGTGDVDIHVLERLSGLPILAFLKSNEEFSMSGSLLMGFTMQKASAARLRSFGVSDGLFAM